MGNQTSHGADGTADDDEIRQGPHNFFLVFGKPSIRYARERTRGPLIYDVEMDYDDDECAVEHSKTMDLCGAVPRRQPFILRSPESSPSSRGVELSFAVALSRPVRRLRVFADVTIAYRSGEGLLLKQDGNDFSPPLCIFDCEDVEDGPVQTKAFYCPRQLHAVTYEDMSHGPSLPPKRCATYAPLVIELFVDEVELRGHHGHSHPRPSRTAAAEGEDEGEGRAVVRKVPSPPLPSRRAKVIHYTLLDLPAEALDYMSNRRSSVSSFIGSNVLQGVGGRQRSSLTATALPEAPANFNCTVVKQLLQVGREVYELEDVFDVGRDDDRAETATPAAEDDDGDICVICLTNHKDTTLLPCRHLCLCHECAAHLRLTNNRCPLCRGNIERVMTI